MSNTAFDPRAWEESQRRAERTLRGLPPEDAPIEEGPTDGHMALNIVEPENWPPGPPPDDVPPYVAPGEGQWAPESPWAPEATNPLEFTSAATLAGVKIPRRRWLVPGRVPMRAVTILSGDGASGKTTILLQLCEAVVCGSDWLGAPIEEQGPALFVTAEEEHDEIHRRLANVTTHSGRPISGLEAFHFKCLPGEDSTLAVPDPRNGGLRPTPLYHRLEAAALEIKPRLVAIEAAADVYGGNENDRGQVRQFVQLLRGLAIGADAAVVLLQHPSVSGLAEGQGRSGTTAWRNSARAQLYFSGIKSTEEGEPEGDVRELRVVKSNYSRQGEAVRVRWQDGVFVPIATAGSPERAAAEAKIDDLFLQLLDQFNAQGRPVTDSPMSRSGAPIVFAKSPGANGTSKTAFERSMERLFAAGTIKIIEGGKPSRPTRSLARA